MATRKRANHDQPRPVAAGSWLALLAATTIGAGADTLRAEVKADGLREGAPYRLVVQTYDAARGSLPDRDARPVASAQRAVTAAELRAGVQVNLLELRGDLEGTGDRPVVVAWVEAGQPDLEFDGRTARPRPGSVYGTVRRADRRDFVQISLNRKVAA
jgi:hypothetical protein